VFAVVELHAGVVAVALPAGDSLEMLRELPAACRFEPGGGPRQDAGNVPCTLILLLAEPVMKGPSHLLDLGPLAESHAPVAHQGVVDGYVVLQKMRHPSVVCEHAAVLFVRRYFNDVLCAQEFHSAAAERAAFADLAIRGPGLPVLAEYAPTILVGPAAAVGIHHLRAAGGLQAPG